MGRRAGLVRPATFALLLALLPAARDALCQTIIVLSNTRGLNFGRFAALTGGAITINAATGARTKTGTVVLMNSPTAAQATYNVSKSKNGNVSQTVSITLPANNIVKMNSGANQMSVNNFVASPATITSVPNGGMVLSVGATVSVANGQPSGNYAGTFNITVNYN